MLELAAVEVYVDVSKLPSGDKKLQKFPLSSGHNAIDPGLLNEIFCSSVE
jgi:hypothetical protein